LVVEDDKSLLALLQAVLTTSDIGYELDWTTNAEDALIALNKNTYDIVLADYYLEGIQNGLDLWKNHNLASKRRTPFLIMSSMPKREYIKLSPIEIYKPTFLQKPFSLSECKDVVNEIGTEKLTLH